MYYSRAGKSCQAYTTMVKTERVGKRRREVTQDRSKIEEDIKTRLHPAGIFGEYTALQVHTKTFVTADGV